MKESKSRPSTVKKSKSRPSAMKESKSRPSGQSVLPSKVLGWEMAKHLAEVLSDPVSNRKALPAATQTAIQCFETCICSLGGGDGKSKKKKLPFNSDYMIKREELFDAVLQICFTNMGRCLAILLHPIEDESKKAKQIKKHSKNKMTSFKNWHKFGPMAKRYLNAMCSLLDELEHNEDVITEALESVAAIVDLYLHFPKACKLIVKAVVKLWSRRSEKVQSAAFIVLSKFVRLNASMAFSLIYRNCYVAYISNSKQVNEETKPLIEFMQKCFVELSLLAPKQAYEYAFVYIRQFAIHLRTAIMGKKKDLIPSVYNWQFLNGLSLWATVVAQSARDPEKFQWFRDLCHPLVEITILLKRSFMSSKYTPLGIFCVRILLRIQRGCNIFVPTLSMSLELLNELLQIDKTKPSAGKGAQKSVDVGEIVRVSKLQLQDAGVRMALAQNIFGAVLESCEALKDDVAFPEILVPLEPIVKNFIKQCRNPEHVEMAKSLNKKMLKQSEAISASVAAHPLNIRELIGS